MYAYAGFQPRIGSAVPRVGPPVLLVIDAEQAIAAPYPQARRAGRASPPARHPQAIPVTAR
jgi:hypothetical protein